MFDGFKEGGNFRVTEKPGQSKRLAGAGWRATRRAQEACAYVCFSIKAGGNCNRQIKCLLVSVSGSFADSLNHAREGSGRERREGGGMTNSIVL